MNTSASSSNSFALTSELEILGALKGLCKSQKLMQVRTNSSSASMLSTLLEIEQEDNTLVFDGTSDAGLLKQLISAKQLHFEASDGGVHISFTTGPALDRSINNSPVLLLPFPKEVIRIQRRDAFRIETPTSEPLFCTVNHPDGPIALPLVDISTGGLGVSDNAHRITDPVGTIYKNSRLNLPGATSLEINLRLVRIQEFERAEKPLRNLGFSFHQLRPAAQMQVQRYITMLERSALARNRGFS